MERLGDAAEQLPVAGGAEQRERHRAARDGDQAVGRAEHHREGRRGRDRKSEQPRAARSRRSAAPPRSARSRADARCRAKMNSQSRAATCEGPNSAPIDDDRRRIDAGAAEHRQQMRRERRTARRRRPRKPAATRRNASPCGGRTAAGGESPSRVRRGHAQSARVRGSAKACSGAATSASKAAKIR